MMDYGDAVEESYGLEDYSVPEPVKSIDPVCGKTVDQARAAGKIGFWGQMYYFCSEDCMKNFTETPERYAGQQR